MERSFFLSLGGWGWMLAGFVLMALELVVPGTVFLWFGLAALITGAVALAVDIGWQLQIALFATLATASLLGWRWWRGRMRNVEGDVTLNSRASRHVGRRFVLTEPIVAGEARVRIDDTYWRVTGPDCPSGTEIVVVGTDGAVLRVEPATAP